MSLKFPRVALVGKYHESVTGNPVESTLELVAEIGGIPDHREPTDHAG